MVSKPLNIGSCNYLSFIDFALLATLLLLLLELLQLLFDGGQLGATALFVVLRFQRLFFLMSAIIGLKLP